MVGRVGLFPGDGRPTSSRAVRAAGSDGGVIAELSSWFEPCLSRFSALRRSRSQVRHGSATASILPIKQVERQFRLRLPPMPGLESCV